MTKALKRGPTTAKQWGRGGGPKRHRADVLKPQIFKMAKFADDRQIAKRFGISRKDVRRVLAE